MAFKFVGNVKPSPDPLCRLKLPVTNGVAITLGELVYVLNGRFSTMATGGVCAGVSVTEGTVTGNAGGTNEIEAQILCAGDLLEIAQTPLSDANSQVGDQCDVATGNILAADSNHDFIVWKQNTVDDILWVQVQKRQFGN